MQKQQHEMHQLTKARVARDQGEVRCETSILSLTGAAPSIISSQGVFFFFCDGPPFLRQIPQPYHLGDPPTLPTSKESSRSSRSEWRSHQETGRARPTYRPTEVDRTVGRLATDGGLVVQVGDPVPMYWPLAASLLGLESVLGAASRSSRVVLPARGVRGI